MTVTSVQPRRTSSSASAQPTMPAPMIATRGVAVMTAPCSGDANGADDAIAGPAAGSLGWVRSGQDAGIHAFHLASLSAIHLAPASSRLIASLAM